MALPASVSNADPDFTEFVRTGGEEAFRRLVTRHMGMVHSAARRLLGNRGDAAADVAQSVFCQLARRAAVLPPDLVVSLWLHTQTRRAALNHLRAETRRGARERTAADLMRMNAPDPPDPAALSALLTPHIDSAIGELPALEQRALALRFFEELELQEIGSRLGLSAGAVRKRLERALEKLRAGLSRCGVTLTAAVLAGWLSRESVQAAPASVTASAVSAAMAAPAAQSAGGFLSFLTVMSGIKSLLIGAALGLAGGGFWVIQSELGTASSTAHAAPRSGSRQTAIPPSAGNGMAASLRYTVPVPAGNAEALMEQLNGIIAAPDTEETRQRLAAWLEGVPSHLWEPLVNLADHRLSWRTRARWLPDLARQWAKVDPERAILSLPKRDGYGNMSGPELAACAFKVWHESSPDKALSWLVEQQDNPALAQCLPNLISVVGDALAEVSADATLRWASQLQGDDLQQAALEPLWKKLDSSRSPRAWAELSEKLLDAGDTGFNRATLRATLYKWSICEAASPADIDKWLAALPDSSRKRRAAELILGNALATNAETSPAQALEVVTGTGAAETSSTAARLIMEADFPGPGARQWLLPLITGPERETAIFKAARSAASGLDSFPVSNHQAAIAWAAELSDPRVRDPLVYGLFQNLLEHQQKETQSTDEALKWVETSGLNPEAQGQLRHAAKDFQARQQP